MVGTTDTGVRVVVATVPYGEEDRLAAAGRLFAAAAAGEVPAPQAVRWNAARDGVEVAFASPEFEQVAKSEKLRVRVSELARMPARVVRGGQVARVSGSAGGDTPPG